MKTLIVLLIAFFFAGNTFANEIPNNATYFLLEGRQDAIGPVSELLHNMNQTGIPIQSEPNTLLGNEYVRFSYIQNGQVVDTEKISITNPLVRGIERHLKNPRTGESIAQVCGGQAGQFTKILNLGRNSYQISQPQHNGGDLSGIKESMNAMNSGIRDLNTGQNFISDQLSQQLQLQAENRRIQEEMLASNLRQEEWLRKTAQSNVRQEITGYAHFAWDVAKPFIFKEGKNKSLSYTNISTSTIKDSYNSNETNNYNGGGTGGNTGGTITIPDHNTNDNPPTGGRGTTQNRNNGRAQKLTSFLNFKG